jgi:hypothetical protein
MDATVNVEAREDAYSRPLDSIDVSVPELYQDDVYQPYSPLTAELGGPARATLLDERAHRGTGSSNPLPSSGESTNFRFLSRRRQVSGPRSSVRVRPALRC